MKPNKYPFRERNVRLSVRVCWGGDVEGGGSCSQFYSLSLKSIGTHTCTHCSPIIRPFFWCFETAQQNGRATPEERNRGGGEQLVEEERREEKRTETDFS